MPRSERDIIRDWQAQWGMSWRPDSDTECMCGCAGTRCLPGQECYAEDDCLCGLNGCACVRHLNESQTDATLFLLEDQRRSGLSVRAYEKANNLYLGLDRGWGRAGDLKEHETHLSELSDKLTTGATNDCD